MKRVQPTLAAGGESGPKTDFDDFRLGEFFVQFTPERVIGLLGIPKYGFGVAQRNFFAAAESVGLLESK